MGGATRRREKAGHGPPAERDLRGVAFKHVLTPATRPIRATQRVVHPSWKDPHNRTSETRNVCGSIYL